MWLFKGLGMILIMCVCSAAGLFKSYSAKHRAEKLCLIARSLNTLGERLNLKADEIIPLLKQSFPEGLLVFYDSGVGIDETYLNGGDTALLKEFFEGLGLNDCEGEYRRIIGYARIISDRSKAASEDNESLCRLYKSCGFLSGLFLCIFFL